MRFVLGNRHLLAAGGTEVHLVTVAEHLQRLGHEVALYASEIGPFGDHVRRRGLDVHDSLRTLPASCDATFSQDAMSIYDLAERYPDALSVFRICGDVADFQLPPQLTAVADLIVVLSDRYERIARACADSVPVVRLPVPIDIDRLIPLGAVRERPERAVMLGNYLERDALLSDVWGGLGVDVQRVGGHVQTYDVATAVADADIVVAKSRAALDAMACGRPVYVFDVFGGDGWVTPELYPALEADNFAGLATGRVIDAATLASDLSAYRPEMGTANRDLVLQHHNARDHVVALMDAIGEREPQERGPAPLRELARLTAMQWSWELTAREFRSMHWPLREHAAASEQRSAEAVEAARQAERERDEAAAHARRLEAHVVRPLREEIDRLQAQLHAARATRAWKLATAFRRIKRRLRRSRRQVVSEPVEAVEDRVEPNTNSVA